MHREWLKSAKILTGICALSCSSFSQTYTVSAKPGAVNFIEGDVTLNGDPIWTSNLKSTFLNTNDVIAVSKGRAEVLLTPGVFLRLADNAQVRMIRPSLIETQIEIISGESMIEVDDVVPGSSVAIMDHGSFTTLVKPGLYRFTEHSIATLEGKAEVAVGGKKVSLKKNKEVEISEMLLAKKVDLSQGDDLYAWSNVRAQYNAAATYAGSTQAYQSGGYGFSSFNSPGWYWNSPYNSYMWMPGNGAFYSPFGWGFYGPGVVAYAPVIGVPYGYGGYTGSTVPVKSPTTTPTATTTGITKPAPVRVNSSSMMVPVNPRSVPVTNFRGTSPASFAAARLQMQQTFAYSGIPTASGAPAANLRNGQSYPNTRAASQAATSSANSSSAPSQSSSRNSGYSGGGGGGFSNSRSAGSAAGGGSAPHSAGGASRK